MFILTVYRDDVGIGKRSLCFGKYLLKTFLVSSQHERDQKCLWLWLFLYYFVHNSRLYSTLFYSYYLMVFIIKFYIFYTITHCKYIRSYNRLGIYDKYTLKILRVFLKERFLRCFIAKIYFEKLHEIFK